MSREVPWWGLLRPWTQPWTRLWLTAPLELHGVWRLGSLNAGLLSKQTLYVHVQCSVPFGIHYFFHPSLPGVFLLGNMPKLKWNLSLPSKHRLMKKYSHAESWFPLLRPCESLAPRAGPRLLPCSGNAILRSSGAGMAWLCSRPWSVSY